MIKEFEPLTSEERKLLYKAPVLVSVLVSCAYHEVNATMKKDAIKLVHLRTFTAPPLLVPYYQEVEKTFKEEFEKAVKTYYPFDEENKAKIMNEMDKVNNVITKLDAAYAIALNRSLKGYAKHVKRSVYNVFQDFIFPLCYSRLNN